MNDDVITRRVRAAMDASGLSQAELADRIGFDRPKMSKSLSGARRLTSLDLAKIADVCEVTADYLLGVDRPAAALAARVSEQSALDTASVAKSKAAKFAQHRADLTFLGYPLPVMEFQLPVLHGRMYEQGAILGDWAVDQIEAAERNVTDRDLAGVIEDTFAVDVAVEALPDRFDGLAWGDEDSRLILVGTSSQPGRQRFTLAHELCHLLVGDNQHVLHLDTDVHDKAHRSERSEIRANAFAASFLMPKTRLLSAAEQGLTLESCADLSCSLSVSPSSLGYRLANLGLIRDDQRDALVRMSAADAARLSGRAGELGQWIEHSRGTRIPQRLVRDAFTAYTSGDTTLRPYANLIGMDVDDLNKALEAATDDVLAQ